MKKNTPWVILACAMGLMLIIGAGISITSIVDGLNELGSSSAGAGVQRGSGAANANSQKDSDASRSYAEDLVVVNPGQIYSIDELEELYGVSLQQPDGDSCYAGIYEVGKTHDLIPGIYHMDGDQEDMSHFCIFSPRKTASKDGYQIKALVEYFGDYFAEFSEGELVVFIPDNDNFTMSLSTDEPMDVSEPLDSGCYRVGIDIPAGTYDLTLEAVSQREIEYSNSVSAAYVMKDLRFDDDSIVSSVPVESGAMASVTVEDGQYLELFGARASLSE